MKHPVYKWSNQYLHKESQRAGYKKSLEKLIRKKN